MASVDSLHLDPSNLRYIMVKYLACDSYWSTFALCDFAAAAFLSAYRSIYFSTLYVATLCLIGATLCCVYGTEMAVGDMTTEEATLS